MSSSDRTSTLGNLFGEGFDGGRYFLGTCQCCERPCAVRCGCGEVVEQDSVGCPACGYYYFAPDAARDETGRVLMVVCSSHAA
jgi:hypothetical protein